jgi:hypothetical protein
VLGNKAILSLLELQAWLDDVAHADQNSRSHRSLTYTNDARTRKTWNQIAVSRRRLGYFTPSGQ